MHWPGPTKEAIKPAAGPGQASLMAYVLMSIGGPLSTARGASQGVPGRPLVALRGANGYQDTPFAVSRPTLAFRRGFDDDSGAVSNLKSDRPWGPPADDKGEARAHLHALLASKTYLPRDRLRDRFMYLIASRTASFGVWLAEKERFEGLVTRGADDLVTSATFHWDTFRGTAKPFVELGGPVPLGTELGALAAKQREITYDHYVAMTLPFADPERAAAEDETCRRRLKEAMAQRTAREAAGEKT